jgi:hypothetical protein
MEYKPGDVVATKDGSEYTIATLFDGHGQKMYCTYELHTIFDSDIKHKVGIKLMNGEVSYKDEFKTNKRTKRSKR